MLNQVFLEDEEACRVLKDLLLAGNLMKYQYNWSGQAAILFSFIRRKEKTAF
jgi:hypothetical protein